MAIGAPNIVAPMLATPKVVVLLSACMAGQTGIRNFLGRFVFERDDLLRITFLYVSLAGPMTRLTPGDLVFPTAQTAQLAMCRRNKVFELILVAAFAHVGANIPVISSLLRREVIVSGLNSRREGIRKSPQRQRE